VYSIGSHGLMKKWVLHVHCLQVNKHTLNSQITINLNSKPNKILFFKCGFGNSRVQHGGTNKMLIKIAYIAHARVCEFLEGK